MTTAALASAVRYSGSLRNATWYGHEVGDRERFAAFLREVVRSRVSDAESGFEADLRGLATTNMATERVEQLLRAAQDPEGWEIGEALAECALQTDSGRKIDWPWNTVRDRRTPRASLPGTDLVGFCTREEGIFLVFGEVKTSSEKSTPPQVMYGGSGMMWQLEQSAHRLDIQRTLLQWLYTRCVAGPFRDMYETAVSRFLSSGGKDLLIIGVLIRDTEPNEADLQGRGEALVSRLPSPTRIELFAWYLPVPIAEWPRLLREQSS